MDIGTEKEVIQQPEPATTETPQPREVEIPDPTPATPSEIPAPAGV